MKRNFTIHQCYNGSKTSAVQEIYFNKFEDAKKKFYELANRYKYNFPSSKITKEEDIIDGYAEGQFDGADRGITLVMYKNTPYRKPTEKQININLNKEFSKKESEQGYYIQTVDEEGMKLLCAIKEDKLNRSIGCAEHAERIGQYKIIPVDELPEDFPERYYGWIDTKKNRNLIRKHTKTYKTFWKPVPEKYKII